MASLNRTGENWWNERINGIPFDLRKAHADSFKKVGEEGNKAVNTLGVFLGQELSQFNGLIAVMAASLHQLQLVTPNWRIYLSHQLISISS